MKRSVKSLILLGALILLLGSYALVNQMNRPSEISEDAGTFALVERDADELAGLLWVNDGVEYHFEKVDDAWQNADDPAFPTDQQAVQDMANRLLELSATRKLTGVESPQDYGFDENSYTVPAEWSDGSATQYILGDETPFADGYYLRIEGEDGVVYTLGSSLSAMFAETAIDLAELEEIETVEAPSELQVGAEMNLHYCAESISIDPDQHWYDASDAPMDDVAVEALIEDINALEWQSLLNVSATEAEFAQYQLDDASATLIHMADTDGGGLDLYIGAVDESGDYYARLPGSDRVYTLPGEDVESILSATDTLWNTTIFPLDYEQLQCFSCTLDGEETVFEAVESDDADDTAKQLWEQIQQLQALSRADGVSSEEALLQISVTNSDGLRADYAFYSYDVDSYLVSTGMDGGMLVSADEVDKLIRTLRQG